MDDDAAVGRLSVEERVGQLFLLAFSGRPGEGTRRLIERHGLGGVYVSQDNAATPEEAAALSAQLQGWARAAPAAVPLLIAADHEGTWSVLAPQAAAGPGNLALGAARDPRWTFAMYGVLGAELRAVGYNTLLAPCVDVNSNSRNAIIGARSFGDRPERVAELAAAAVRGARAQGVLTAAKHFPGHGDAPVDTHRGLAVVDRPADVLRASDLAPFRAAVAAGVDMVMTSHILFPAFDAERPATMSARMLQGLLREELGFGGVVVSDSMNMGAIGRELPPEEAVVRAVVAGVDLVMLAEEHYAHDPATYLRRQESLMAALLAAVRSGRLPEWRLAEAAGRVLALKRRAGLFGRRAPDPEHARRAVGNAVHRQVAAAASAAGVTQLGTRRDLLPLRPGDPLAVVNTIAASSYAPLMRTRGIGPNQATAAFEHFVAAVRLRAPDAAALAAEAAFTADGWLSERVPAQGPVVAVAEHYPLPGEDFASADQAPRLRRLQDALAGRLIVVALRDPYFLMAAAPLEAVLCTCSARPEAAAAAAAALFGEAPAPGRLPVQV